LEERRREIEDGKGGGGEVEGEGKIEMGISIMYAACAFAGALVTHHGAGDPAGSGHPAGHQ
jgi:hypothetical protein